MGWGPSWGKNFSCNNYKGILLYKEKNTDKQPRGIFILADCAISEKLDSDGEIIIVEMIKGEREKIKIMASNHQDH